MRSLLTRLMAGLFCALALAGCPHPVPAKPPVPPPVQVLWYTTDWRTNLDPAQLQAAGVTGVLAVATPWHYGPQNQVMSLDDLRQNARDIKARVGSLQVWWTFQVVQQTPQSRTLCNPQDAAARVQLLNNYSSVGRVAREMGFAGVALDTEAYSVPSPWPDEKGARELGSDLAKAIRQNYPTCGLLAFGPLTGAPDGFKKVWRGFSQAAGNAVFCTEDTYGLSGMDPKGVKQALSRCGDITGARYPAAGWYASTKAPGVDQWFQAAIPKLQMAAKVSPYVMIYREGQMQPPQWDALGRTLHVVRQ